MNFYEDQIDLGGRTRIEPLEMEFPIAAKQPNINPLR